MALKEATIGELGEILREDYGWDGSQTEVSNVAHSLVEYFNILTGIYSREARKNEYDDATIK